MTMPPWDSSGDPLPRDDLPPGFYFPPGEEPDKPPRTNGLAWDLVALAVLILMVLGILAFIFA